MISHDGSLANREGKDGLTIWRVWECRDVKNRFSKSGFSRSCRYL